MSSTVESIAQSLHGQLDKLIDRVSKVDGVASSVHVTEEQLWIGMLGLGRNLMQLHFEACHEAEVVQDSVEVNGVSYAYERPSQRG
jgi:hypothetical protein